MGNLTDWFSRSYKGVIIGLLAVMAVSLAALAFQHVQATAPGSNAEARPAPSYSSGVSTRQRVAIIGDSYTACSQMGGCGSSNYTLRLGSALHWNIKAFAVGGTGYVNNSGGKTTFGERVEDVVNFDPSVVIVEGGRNDVTMLEDLPSAATDTLNRLKTELPDAKIAIIAPIRTASSVPAETTAHDAVLEAANEVGVDLIVDPVADQWFAGSDAQYIGSDKTHPTDAGHQYMAEKLAQALQPLAP